MPAPEVFPRNATPPDRSGYPDYRRLAAADRGHDPVAVGGGDLGVAGLEECLAGHVADLAIGVGGQDPELLPGVDPLDDRVGRE
nr:hypothetical protein [Planctomycetota bacterium]